jgi:hypothetical protein
MSVLTPKEAEVINMLREHSNFYLGKVRDETFAAYAKKLAFMDAHILRAGLNRLAEDAGKMFPSLLEIRQACGDATNKEKETFNLNDHAFESEEKTLAKVKGAVHKAIGEENFEKYFQYYAKEMFGDSYKFLKEYGLTLNMFRKCAYFDLYEAKYKIPEAIKLMHKQVEELSNEENNHKKPQERKVHAWY